MKGKFSNPESVKKTAIRVFAAIYLFVAILTYGHAWNRIGSQSRYQEYRGPCIVGSPFCAAFWPLYWSVVLQENDTKTRKNT